MTRKRFLYLCLVLAILLAGLVTPLFQPPVVVAAPPDTPSNDSPSDNATGILLTPTLQSSVSSDHDGPVSLRLEISPSSSGTQTICDSSWDGRRCSSCRSAAQCGEVSGDRSPAAGFPVLRQITRMATNTASPDTSSAFLATGMGGQNPSQNVPITSVMLILGR